MVKGKNNYLDIRFNRYHGHFGLDSKCEQRNGFCCYRDLRSMIFEAGCIFIKNYRTFGILSYDRILKSFLKDNWDFSFLSRFSFLPFDEPKSLLDYADFIYQLSFALNFRRVSKDSNFNTRFIYDVLKSFNFDKYVD